MCNDRGPTSPGGACSNWHGHCSNLVAGDFRGPSLIQGAAGTVYFQPGGVSFWDRPIQKRENPPTSGRQALDRSVASIQLKALWLKVSVAEPD
jgi:hypothetical protein